MIELRCPSCQLVWNEHRTPGDNVDNPFAFMCPRCEQVADRLTWIDPRLPTDVELNGLKELREKTRPVPEGEPDKSR